MAASNLIIKNKENCSRDIIQLTTTAYNKIDGEDLLIPGDCMAYFLT